MEDKLLQALKIARNYIGALEGELSFAGISYLSQQTLQEQKDFDRMMQDFEKDNLICEALNLKTGY